MNWILFMRERGWKQISISLIDFRFSAEHKGGEGAVRDFIEFLF